MVNNIFSLRRSYRTFLDKKVEDDKISSILEAGMLAPVAKGEYDNIILKVFEGDELKKLQSLLIQETGKDNTYNAPLVIGVYHKGDNVDLANLDTGCIIENMLLQARALDLGSVFIYSICRLTRTLDSLKSYNKVNESFLLRSVAAFGYVNSYNDANNVQHQIKVIK